MKNKEFYAETILPTYEVTELTMEEALLELTAHRSEAASNGMLSEEVLKEEFKRHAVYQWQH